MVDNDNDKDKAKLAHILAKSFTVVAASRSAPYFYILICFIFGAWWIGSDNTYNLLLIFIQKESTCFMGWGLFGMALFFGSIFLFLIIKNHKTQIKYFQLKSKK